MGWLLASICAFISVFSGQIRSVHTCGCGYYARCGSTSAKRKACKSVFSSQLYVRSFQSSLLRYDDGTILKAGWCASRFAVCTGTILLFRVALNGLHQLLLLV